MDIRTRDLKNFLAASRAKTISQAAKTLGISQPALSESIKRLEGEIGTTLFYRSRVGIELTPSGRDFVAKSKLVFSAMADLRLEHHAATSGKRHIKLGIHSSVAQFLLPPVLSQLEDEGLKLNLELHHDSSRSIQHDLQNGLLDLGIVINPSRVQDIVIKPIAQDTVKVWVSPEKSPIDCVIGNHELVQTQAILRKWSNKNAEVFHTTSLELVCRMVVAGLGYGIIPERVVRQNTPQLKMLDDSPSFQDKICMVYRPEFGKHPVERQLIRAMEAFQ
ncbi:MAG: LysR family transcriptional regulator [Pseudobacteriovorax sp.]|nr:LysR family transcriptional regulator [Pseudobacteriovorax sp.]